MMSIDVRTGPDGKREARIRDEERDQVERDRMKSPLYRSPSSARKKKLGRAYRELRQEPDCPELRLALAHQLLEIGRRDLALRHARKAEVAPAPSPQRQHRVAVALMRCGAFEDAYELLKRSLDRLPANAPALRDLSALLHRDGRRKDALRARRIAARVDPVIRPARERRDAIKLVAVRSTLASPFGFNYSQRRLHWNRRLRGGHFAMNAWLEGGRYDVWSVDCHGENLLSLESPPVADVIVNTVSDAELEPRSLAEISRWLDTQAHVPVINHPARVLETTRVRNSVRLAELDGVVFPRTRLFRIAEEPRATVEAIVDAGFSLPVILRRPGTQTGQSMVRVRTIQDLERRLAKFGAGETIYVIQFHDARGSRRHHHKARCFFVDGVFHPIASLSNDTWQIHSGDRYRVMAGDPATQEAERHYLSDPESFLGQETMARLQAVAEVIDLDWFGIDFTKLPDGRLLVFEANPAMRHNFDHADNFPYTREPLQRASRAFQAMLARRADQG